MFQRESPEHAGQGSHTYQSHLSSQPDHSQNNVLVLVKAQDGQRMIFPICRFRLARGSGMDTMSPHAEHCVF